MPSSIHSSLPEGAILAGHDQDQSPIYIGRAWHGGDQLPGMSFYSLSQRKMLISSPTFFS